MSLSDFPPLGQPGYITTCEQNARLNHVPLDEYNNFKQNMLSDYPSLDERKVSLNHSFSKTSVDSVFAKPESLGFYSNLLHLWRTTGYMAVVDYLDNIDHTDLGPITLWRLLKLTNNIMSTVRSYIPMGKKNLSEEAVQTFEALNWSNSYVRAISWHQNGRKLAVALQSDSIRIYGIHENDTAMRKLTGQKSSLIWTLRHPLQKNITALAWKPYSLSVLAVACETCVIVWHLDNASLATKPSSQFAQELKPHSYPVNSLSWSPTGRFLLASSPNSTKVTIFDIYSEQSDYVGVRFGFGGVERVMWSPDGSKVCICYTSALIRVYETEGWLYESWSRLSGPCRAAVWDADGSVLLFSPSGSCHLFCLSFRGCPRDIVEQRYGPDAKNKTEMLIGGSQNALPLFDLSAIQANGNGVLVGGDVNNMIWDCSANRLAISFKETPESVALFRVRSHPTMDIQPIGFIRSGDDAYASLISFQPNYENGALVTVVWSNGKIHFIPLIFLRDGASAQQRINLSNLFDQSRSLSLESTNLYSVRS